MTTNHHPLRRPDPKPVRKLISLAAYERFCADAGDGEACAIRLRNIPNSIACPDCGAELVDTNRGVVLTSLPPQYAIHCPSCPFTGNRTIL